MKKVIACFFSFALIMPAPLAAYSFKELTADCQKPLSESTPRQISSATFLVTLFLWLSQKRRESRATTDMYRPTSKREQIKRALEHFSVRFRGPRETLDAQPELIDLSRKLFENDQVVEMCQNERKIAQRNAAITGWITLAASMLIFGPPAKKFTQWFFFGKKAPQTPSPATTD